MLSILIPIYNTDVGPLVAALVAQTEKLDQEIEILLRDDGSTTMEEANRSLANLPKVHYSTNTKNLGRSATRQALAQEAQFEQLLFLDADVLPTGVHFLKQYLEAPKLENQIGCGGIVYQSSLPEQDQVLRYVYGVQRESLTAAQRQQRPYMVLSANLWIPRKLFLEFNDQLENFYGDDLVLSQKIRTKGLPVIHLDNPVAHLGLESSEAFLNKTEEMIHNLVRLEKEGQIQPDLMRLQTAYIKLHKTGLCKLFAWLVRSLRGPIRRNLLGSKPSIRLLDAFKLQRYTELKRNA